MNLKIKKIIPFVFSGLFLASSAYAIWPLTGYAPPTGISQETNLLAIVINITTWIVGVTGAVAVLMLIYGGFRYITAHGNEDEIKQAKRVILWAVVGIIVVLIAFTIVMTVQWAILTGT